MHLRFLVGTRCDFDISLKPAISQLQGHSKTAAASKVTHAVQQATCTEVHCAIDAELHR